MIDKRSRINLFTLAGVLTAPHFLDGFRTALERRMSSERIAAESRSLFPYGDWGCSRTKQLAEISLDLWRSKIGGSRAARQIEEAYESGAIVVAGHSGGGIAAVQAARLLAHRGLPIAGVVMIGAPKLPLPEELKDTVIYIYAEDAHGRRSDPVTRIGRWGKMRPGIEQAVSIIGGHRDYFRTKSPFVDVRGRSNLQLTEEAVWAWLAPRIHRFTKR